MIDPVLWLIEVSQITPARPGIIEKKKDDTPTLHRWSTPVVDTHTDNPGAEVG